MSENATTTDPELIPNPKVHQQVAELRELATQFPEPTLPEVLADWEWLYAQANNGTFWQRLDGFVAVCEKQILAVAEDDELALRIRLAKEHQKHPERFVITYFGEYVRPEFTD